MTTMEHFAGLDISLEITAVCVVDDQGRIVAEGSVATDPDLIAIALKAAMGMGRPSR